jgi:hypothetical protein
MNGLIFIIYQEIRTVELNMKMSTFEKKRCHYDTLTG